MCRRRYGHFIFLRPGGFYRPQKILQKQKLKFLKICVNIFVNNKKSQPLAQLQQPPDTESQYAKSEPGKEPVQTAVSVLFIPIVQKSPNLQFFKVTKLQFKNVIIRFPPELRKTFLENSRNFKKIKKNLKKFKKKF